MSAASELIQRVEGNGGQFRVDDGWLVIAPGEAAMPVIEELRKHKAAIIGVLESRNSPPHDPAEWREPFARWLDSVCVRDPRCWGGVGCLHIAFCEWAVAQNDVPCNRFTFECLLRELGFLLDEVAGVGLVSGLTFREDLESAGLRPTGVARTI